MYVKFSLSAAAGNRKPSSTPRSKSSWFDAAHHEDDSPLRRRIFKLASRYLGRPDAFYRKASLALQRYSKASRARKNRWFCARSAYYQFAFIQLQTKIAADDVRLPAAIQVETAGIEPASASPLQAVLHT